MEPARPAGFRVDAAFVSGARGKTVSAVGADARRVRSRQPGPLIEDCDEQARTVKRLDTLQSPRDVWLGSLRRSVSLRER